MKKVKIILISVFAGILVNFAAFASEIENISADEALNKLQEGNRRFSSMHLKHPDQNIKRRIEGLKGQHPFVIVISCSDSRVPPELVFDQGLGDIFEIRNAGNVLDDHVIGSIEYAVAHLGVKLIIVMGHQDCGAIKAAINHNKESIHLESIVKSIEPAIKAAQNQSGNFYENTISMNAILAAKELEESEPIIKSYKEHGVKIFPAYYHIDSGKVEILTK